MHHQGVGVGVGVRVVVVLGVVVGARVGVVVGVGVGGCTTYVLQDQPIVGSMAGSVDRNPGLPQIRRGVS